MYSQNQEELYISEYFKDYVGTFLDIGAYDGITFSNVYNLLLNKWKGVCVEASPQVFNRLQNNLQNLNVELLCACVTIEEEKIIDWYDNAEATATCIIENVEKWKNQTAFQKMKMPTTSINKILEYFNYDYDFINIDVEGNSAHIFIYIYEKLKNVKMFCVEHDNMIEDILNIAVNHKLLYQNGENVVLVLK